MRLSREMVT